MFSLVLDKVSGLLGERTSAATFLPVLSFIGLALYVSWLAGGGSTAELVAKLTALDLASQLLLSVLVLLFAYIMALLATNNSTTIIQLFEGYIGPWHWLAPLGRSYHKSKSDTVGHEVRYLLYPSDADDVMPTRLGNILKTAETHPRDLYGIEAVIIWPRLLRVVTAEVLAELANARQGIEHSLVISLLASVFGGVSALVLPWTGVSMYFVATVAAPSFVVAGLAYRASLGAAIGYAEIVKSVFDIYRADLLILLGAQAPATNNGERLLWQQLSNSWYRSGPVSIFKRW